ncbi:uncharacterized protein LOC129579243 [Sitodiplosis mosellana]|uniref:uncharacterized protein LOC129579243 n=1 Tax=Sitodiplosis mosellana TaxID=263140 RepID=UPI002443FC6C|nr:uncharacterized protein LOC129579243 [Sitodiplosis mosellana]
MSETKPRIKLLNGTELIAQRKLFDEIDGEYLVRGEKATFPINTEEERTIIKSYQDDLRKVLSMERVALQNERSTAVIEDGKIKVTKRQGKWDVFESSGQYLEPHVALFYMELNRLEVYLGKMIVSLERAYHMFLAHDNSGRSDKLTKNEYVVYANFMRFGCHIRRFKNESPESYTSSEDESDDNETVQSDAAIQKSYIWNYLYELLGHRKTAIKSGSIDTNRYSNVKESMNVTIGKFKIDDSVETITSTSSIETSERTVVPEKRKLPSDESFNAPACKSAKLSDKFSNDGQYFGSGSTNDFMIGNTFQRFKQIFDQIDIIDVKKPDSYDDQQPINEKFSFDLWTELDNRFWSQHKGPDFRLIVKQPSKSLPHNDDIFRLYNSLAYKSAIILVCTNKEMSFQAYVYRFTT